MIIGCIFGIILFIELCLVLFVRLNLSSKYLWTCKVYARFMDKLSWRDYLDIMNTPKGMIRAFTIPEWRKHCEEGKVLEGHIYHFMGSFWRVDRIDSDKRYPDTSCILTDGEVFYPLYKEACMKHFGEIPNRDEQIVI